MAGLESDEPYPVFTCAGCKKTERGVFVESSEGKAKKKRKDGEVVTGHWLPPVGWVQVYTVMGFPERPYKILCADCNKKERAQQGHG